MFFTGGTDYGIMRSIGMGTHQLYKMIAAEVFTYAILGCAAGCALGLPLNRAMFRKEKGDHSDHPSILMFPTVWQGIS